MATIAIDATYTVDAQPSGVAIYCRRLIESLAEIERDYRYLLCYRLSRFKQRHEFMRPEAPAGAVGPHFATRHYQDLLTFWLPHEAELFHSLVQRPPAFRFRKEIVTVIDLFPITGRNYSTPEFQRKFAALLIEAVRRAVRVIAPSQHTIEQLLAHTPVAREDICLIPFGVDLPAAPVCPERACQERENLVGRGNEMILMVGVVQTRKNTLNALKALRTLPARYRMVIAGGIGHGGEEAFEYIRKEGLNSRVTVLGYVPAERLPVLYAAASLFLFPSFDEGFGLPVLEAMAHGVPVVASQTSSLPEVGGDAAIYVDPHDPRDFAEKIIQAAEDAELRSVIIKRGLNRARAFSWRRSAEETVRVYDEVLGIRSQKLEARS